VDCVNLVTGLGQEFLIKRLDFLVVDFLHASKNPADKVVMVMIRRFIYQLSVADVGYQDQALFGQKIQGTVNSGLGQARQVSMHMLVNLGRGEVATCLI
jgi:hypothetical protein